MKDVLREEKKFLLNTAEASRQSMLLEGAMIQDKYNGPTGYMVRSLYFDTVYDSDYFEKEAGTETRRKVRLRIYSTDDDKAYLELKQKQGAYQHKRSLTMSREDAESLIHGNYEVLLNYKEPVAAEMYVFMKTRCYVPKAIVQYYRKAFKAKENRIRITFDSHIEATESCFDLFSPTLNMNPVMDRGVTILEVKYNGFLLTYIKDLLNSVEKSELSVSKYVLARQHGCRTRLI